MAVSKQIGSVTDAYSPDFIEELLPCSQKVSLLYHVSYLCLAGFPRLEGLLRTQAVETQLLFGDSEALLLKCLGTSTNLVTTLFPVLTVAVKKNRTLVAQNLLEQAENWIKEIVDEVSNMVQRYNQRNRELQQTTTDIFSVKKEMEKNISNMTEEMKQKEADITKLKEQQLKVSQELASIETKIDAKNRELQDQIRELSSRDRGLGFYFLVVPFTWFWLCSTYDSVKKALNAKIKTLEAEITTLTAQKGSLRQKEWELQFQQVDLSMKLAKIKIDKGVIPDPVHLGEVQAFLTRIQEILVQLKTFWGKIQSMLSTLKEKTFVNNSFITDSDFTDIVLNSIEAASKAWGSFGKGCARGAQIFREQNKDAYRFLQIDPSSLAKDVWQREYDSVMTQLKNIDVTGENKCPVIELVQ